MLGGFVSARPLGIIFHICPPCFVAPCQAAATAGTALLIATFGSIGGGGSNLRNHSVRTENYVSYCLF